MSFWEYNSFRIEQEEGSHKVLGDLHLDRISKGRNHQKDLEDIDSAVDVILRNSEVTKKNMRCLHAM